MKTVCLVFNLIFLYTLGYSQIGIGTTSPDTSSIIDIASQESGLLIPRMTTTERNAIISPVHGLMIFNTDKACMELNYGTSGTVNWNCVGTFSTSAVSTDCTTNGFEGNYINSVAFTASNTFSVTITNNSFSNADLSFVASDLVLSGVGGISVTSVSPPSVTLTSGASQLVEYTLSGTPTSTGILLGAWTKLGLNCVQQVNVVSGGATFTLPNALSIFSLSDGVPLFDEQGIIDNGSNQITLSIPYTSGVGTYEAYTGTYILNNSGTGEVGDINRFRLSYPGGTFSSSGSITVTVDIDGDGVFNAKKQLFGNVDTIVTLNFIVNGISYGAIVIDAAGGILDRHFSDSDHEFVYLPVTASDGNIWLNNNLGANYSNATHVEFNPGKQATAYNDYNAYGSLFQWGRYSDGHELINWTDSLIGTPVNGITTIKATTETPLNALFITEANFPFLWQTYEDNTLWLGETGVNNPCPTGFRLPTETEITTLFSVENITNYSNAVSNHLAFTASGYRNWINGSIQSPAVEGRYITTSSSGALKPVFRFDSSSTFIASSGRVVGNSIRCIKD